MRKIKSPQPYINGTYSNIPATKTMTVINPASEQTLCEIAIANEGHVQAAIAASQSAFTAWRAYSGAERGKILRRAADLLRHYKADLAYLETQNTGKPIRESLEVDIDSGADCLDYFAGLAPSLAGRHIHWDSAFAYTRREPLGICLGIGAWNYPLQIACWKSAPALACGNVMIFKPSELTPTTALKLAEIYTEAGLPDGVFNVLPGDRTLGECLTSHPAIAKVSLTGSRETGKAVMQNAAASLKYVTMELGGKSPLIIFEDANLHNAVAAAVVANFYTQGEICSNGTRVFVHESRLAEFLAELKQRLDCLIIGDPLQQDTDIGPLISQAQQQKVLHYIELGQQEGARLFYGAKDCTIPKHGFFVAPTVFVDCQDNMQIVQEEIFGPVMSILTFTDEHDVVARANDTTYGLAAGIFTQNLTRAHRVIAALEAGTCWINNYNITPIEMPFGGYKESGIGRENGLAALHHYTQIKSVYVELGDVAYPYRTTLK